MRVATLALICAALVGLVTADGAAADSIAYVKGGNVWIAEPDGSRHFQVTRSGGYSYVSQADDGTLIALAGRRIHRLDRQTGAVTADFATPVSDTPPGAAFVMTGPIDPVISPDGTRIAYGYNAQYIRHDPYCGYYGGCWSGKLIVGTGYSHADRLTGWDEPGFKQHSGWQWPSWLDNGRTLITDPAEILNKQFWVDPVGDDKSGSAWFRDDSGNPSSRDAEANRQLTALAAVEGPGGNEKSIHLWKMNGGPPAEPSSCFYLNLGPSDPGVLGSPSWSPAGNSLAFEENGGIALMRNLDIAGCDPASAPGSTLLVADASSPDWGPAGVPVVSAGGGGGGGGGGTSNGGALSVKAPKGVKLAAALRKGVALTVRTGGPGKVTLVAKAKGTRVGGGTGKAGTSGKAKVRLRFTKKGARKLRNSKSVRLTLKVAFKPAAGGATRRRTAVLLIRR